MSCDVQFGKFGFWSVRCNAFSELMDRATRNTEDKAVMDLFGFAKVCGILNVFRYPERDLRREMVFALKQAAPEWVGELSGEPDDGSIAPIQRLIAITNAILNQARSDS
jgi:hypothetical protein